MKARQPAFAEVREEEIDKGHADLHDFNSIVDYFLPTEASSPTT
jgi:hypothetical protein